MLKLMPSHAIKDLALFHASDSAANCFLFSAGGRGFTDPAVGVSSQSSCKWQPYRNKLRTCDASKDRNNKTVMDWNSLHVLKRALDSATLTFSGLDTGLVETHNSLRLYQAKKNF